MIGDNRATRLEMCGLLLIVAIAIELICERMAIDRAIINEMIRTRRPVEIQNNLSNQVIIESETSLLRDIATQRGWTNGDMRRTENATRKSEK